MLSTNTILEKNEQNELDENKLYYSRADLRFIPILYLDQEVKNIDEFALAHGANQFITESDLCTINNVKIDKAGMTAASLITYLEDKNIPHESITLFNQFYTQDPPSRAKSFLTYIWDKTKKSILVKHGINNSEEVFLILEDIGADICFKDNQVFYKICFGNLKVKNNFGEIIISTII